MIFTTSDSGVPGNTWTFRIMNLLKVSCYVVLICSVVSNSQFVYGVPIGGINSTITIGCAFHTFDNGFVGNIFSNDLSATNIPIERTATFTHSSAIASNRLTGAYALQTTVYLNLIPHLPMSDATIKCYEGTSPFIASSSAFPTSQKNFSYMKITLVNTIFGRSEQLISQMPFHSLSEIAARYIGYGKLLLT